MEIHGGKKYFDGNLFIVIVQSFHGGVVDLLDVRIQMVVVVFNDTRSAFEGINTSLRSQ